MNWTQTPAGSLDGAVKRFLTALGDDANVVVNNLNTDQGFVDRLAAYAISGGYQPSTSQQRARDIMGTNLFGVEEAMKHFGAKPSKPHLAALTDVPFSEDVLTACKDTHILVAVLPLSILDVRAKPNVTNLFYNQDWYNREQFAKNKGEAVWHLVRKTPVLDSTRKTWDEQQTLLSKDEETPTAQVTVYMIIGHFLATGERLFEKVYVRCADRGSGGFRVSVGSFDAEGLCVNNYWDDYRSVYLGLAAARK